MTGPIRINHDEIDTIIRQVSEVFTGAGDTTPHADTPGIDPAVNQAVAEHDEEDIDVGRSGNEDVETTRNVSREMKEHDEEGRDNLSNVSSSTGLDGRGGTGAGAGAVRSDTAAPAGMGTMPAAGGMPPGGMSGAAYDPSMGMYQSQMPMNQYAPVVDYSAYTPTPATATQYDVTHAPNKEELREAIYQAIRSGNYNSGEPGDDRPRQGGGSRRSGEGDSELEQAYLDAADAYVQAGIPYAWGGGHGPTPGISGGISDGGGHADAMGDYNKQGLDCSGFARAVHYDATGSDDLHGTAAMQYDMTEPVHPDDARPGDLYFPDSAGRPPGHVQVYVGGDQVAEAQQSGTNIMYSDLQPGEFRRVPGY